MKYYVSFIATLFLSSIVFFACGGTSTTLSRSGGASLRCLSDSDCSNGYTCNVEWGTCIAPEEVDPCEGVTCGANETCSNGACIALVACTSNADCAGTEYCELYQGLPESNKCMPKKANGQPCHMVNGPGNDCASSTVLRKTCDFALDSICGIGWRSDPSWGAPPCESDAQCRDGLYCATSADGNDLTVNRCYGKKDLTVHCKTNHQCLSNHCSQNLVSNYHRCVSN